MFDLSWRESGEKCHRPLVVRIKPTGFLVFPDYDLGKQFRIQSRIADSDVPVVSYAAAYPVALILMTVFAQALITALS